MSEPSLALQKALVGLFAATPAITALIGRRFYDRVPRSPDGTPDQQVMFPYVTVGDDQLIDAATDCDPEACDVYATLHIWSRAVGRVECKSIAGALRRALNGIDLDLPDGYGPAAIIAHDARYLADPDGLTTHGVLTLHALIDTAA